MPRPLILKVEAHKPHPGRKVTGSINLEVLRTGSGVCEDGNVASDFASEARELSSRSLVRSLISLYECTTVKQNLSKHKSKSLADLQRTAPVNRTSGTQDDALYNRPSCSGEEKFNFKRVLSRFEDAPQVGHPSKPPASPLNAADVQLKASKLLESYIRGQKDSVWLDQVVELLQQISNKDTGGVNRTSEDFKDEEVTVAPNPEMEVETKKPEDQNNNEPATPTVKDMKSFFEVNHHNGNSLLSLQQNGHIHVSNEKIDRKYFTGNYNEMQEEIGTEDLKNTKETELDETNLDKEPQREQETLCNTPHTSSSSESGHFEMVGNRILPVPNIYTMDGAANQEAVDASTRRIEELVKELQRCEEKINALPEEGNNEADSINDSLTTILIKLDDVVPYGDQKVLAEKKQAIQSAQKCISLLKEKIQDEDGEQRK